MAICYDGFGRSYYCQNSSWYSWGRWVLLGVLIFVFFIIFFLFSCISARRRRQIGRQPMYGTGWAANGPFHSQPAYNPNYNGQQQSYNNSYNNYNKPAGAPPQGGYYGQNQGYFGGQQTGVQMPSQTYQPPAGPPPGKR